MYINGSTSISNLNAENEISQHDPNDSWSTCSMRMTKVAKFQYKLFEVAMLQEKSNPAINERVMPQYTSSYQD